MNLLIEGQKGVVTRLTDKVARLRNLLSNTGDGNGKTPNFESIMDTFGDIANYGIIGQLMQEGGILGDIQRVLILTNYLTHIQEISDFENEMLNNEVSVVRSSFVTRGVERIDERIRMRKLLIDWADAVVIRTEEFMKMGRMIEYAVSKGKTTIVVGEEEEDREMTAECTLCSDTKKAARIILSGGLNG